MSILGTSKDWTSPETSEDLQSIVIFRRPHWEQIIQWVSGAGETYDTKQQQGVTLAPSLLCTLTFLQD